MKNDGYLIYTSGDKTMQTMLLEWIISLRYFGRYSGDVVILDYGIDPYFATLLESSFEVTLYRCEKKGPIVNQRFIDSISMFKDLNPVMAAHFDADIWFQDSVNGVWNLIPHNGVLYAPDQNGWREPYIGTSESHKDIEAYNEKTAHIYRKCSGTIQGGFCAGYVKDLISKFLKFKELLDDGKVENKYGADQYAANLLFDFEHDSAAAYRYNVIGGDSIYTFGSWYTKKYGSNEKAIGNHIIGVLRNQSNRLFRNNHPALFAMFLGMAGHRPLPPAVHVSQWKMNETRDVAAQLMGVILTCKEVGENSIVVGMEQPLICFNDIAATGTIDLGHGEEGIWEKFNLVPQPHMANPSKMFLSQKAVKTLSSLSFDSVFEFAKQADTPYFDLALSVLCVKNELTIGAV